MKKLGDVRNLRPGDRVVISSTIACGYCSYCRAGYYSQCENANLTGQGTAFFGGPAESGAIDGLQAELAHIPFANVGLVKLPDEITDEQAIMISDIFPTGYFGADIAEIESGDTVVVFGCGRVEQFVITSAKLMGAGRMLAVDAVPSRLAMAQAQGAEIIDFNVEDPLDAIKRLTSGIGPDRAIDAVGVDAKRPSEGPAAAQAKKQAKEFEQETQNIARKTSPDGNEFKPAGAPSQVLQ